MASDSKLCIYYQNVRGLRTKLDAFFLAVNEADFDVVVLTETWLDEKIYSAQLFGCQYAVFRNDRNHLNSTKKRGGGVLIAINRRLNCCLDSAIVSNTLEHLWVQIKGEYRTLSLGVIYLPPDRRSDVDSIENHLSSISTVLSQLKTNDLALVFGDYNQSTLIWDKQVNQPPSINVPRSSISASCSALLDGFNLHGLVQINHVLNRNGKLLDLLLVNDSALPECSIQEAIDPLIKLDADHPALEAYVSLSMPVCFENVEDLSGRDFRKANFERIRQILARTDWTTLDTLSSVDQAVDCFTQIVNQAIVRNVPLRRPSPKPAWGNGRLRHLKRLRSAALRKYCLNRNPITKRMFSLASNEYRLYNRLLYRRYTRRTQENLRLNPAQFWSFVKRKRNEEGLPVEIYLGNRHARTPSEKCNLLADHFKHVFNDSLASTTQVNEAMQHIPGDMFSLNVFPITPQLVESAVNKLKTSNAVGPDGIPSCLLKKCFAELIPPLVTLLNRSLENGLFPDRWKSSYMFPVHKKGDKRNIENYRGITSLCACSKVFEIIVYDVLFPACMNYISPDQHGFYRKRSICTNLVPFISECLRNIEDGAQVDVVYTDLKAAFDRVDHAILLAKLEKLGVSELLIRWFNSYLTNRKLRVKVGASESYSFSNSSGVPQGSNLGPLLFSIFLNDVGLILPPGCRLFFADDVKIYVIVRCIEDCQQLQNLIDRFAEWCSTNLLTLSVPKCHVITFHRKKNPIVYNYTMNNHTLQRVDRVRDLGITLDTSLTFKQH